MILAANWLSHLTTESAWEEMRNVVENDPHRAWRIIRAIVGCAPDYDLLSAVAAGPVEDLLDAHGDSMRELIAEEARENARMRICLQATYSDFPPDLKTIIESETGDVRNLAVDMKATVTGEDLALVLAWSRHSDTAWSYDFLNEMTENDPAAACDVLRVLAVFAGEDTRVSVDVFDRAFEPFIRKHFTAYREHLFGLGRKSDAFRQWAGDRKRPAIEDATMWAVFVADLASD